MLHMHVCCVCVHAYVCCTYVCMYVSVVCCHLGTLGSIFMKNSRVKLLNTAYFFSQTSKAFSS